MALERIGHYTIVSELGRGGMGVVYLAHEESLNRYVAIKVLGEQLSDDPSFVARFTREAQSVAALSHPNIIQIFFIGEDAGRHFFVMEYVKGKSLLSIVKEQGKIENPRAAQYMLQAANGLAAAHDQGFLHRDIKPANLLVDERGLLKIADFGLALPQEAVTRLTATGMLVGTPGYLSPEQCMGESLDKRTDIYSLGVTYYELLTATMPFKADSPLALLRKILQEEPPDVGTLNTQVDERTRRIVNRMIAKDRAQRYQDCHELGNDLGEYLGGTAKIAGAAGVAAIAAKPLSGEMEGATTRMPDSGAAAAPGKTTPVGVTPAPPSGATPSAPPAAQSAPAAAPSVATIPVAQSAAATPATATPPPAAVEVIPPASAMVPAPQALPVAAPAAAPRKSHVGLIVVAVLVVFVAAVAAAGFFALRSPFVKRFLPWGSASKTAQPVEQPAQPPSEPASTSTSSETTGGGAIAPPESAGGQTAASSAAAAGGSVTAATGGSSQAEARPASRHRAGIPAGTGSGEAAGSVAASRAPAAAAAALSGVAVGAEGERPIAGIVSGILQSELQSNGMQPVDAATLPATEDLFGGEGAAGVGEMLRRLRGEGIAKLVLARVEPAGSRELRYMGRSDTAYTSRVTVTCYDVGTGRPKGRSLSATFESTSFNQQQAAEKALGPLISDLVQQLR